MFLRATEMNPTDMSLGGFFDVNRNLFKSVRFNLIFILGNKNFVLVVSNNGYIFSSIATIPN